MSDAGHGEVLVLRDRDGNPFVVARALLEQEELMPLRLGGEDYLVPRKTLLASVVTGDSEPGGAATFETPDGVTVRLTQAQLDAVRASSPTEKEAVGAMLDADVVGHGLDFDIGEPGDRSGPEVLSGRLSLHSFIS